MLFTLTQSLEISYLKTLECEMAASSLVRMIYHDSCWFAFLAGPLFPVAQYDDDFDGNKSQIGSERGSWKGAEKEEKIQGIQGIISC